MGDELLYRKRALEDVDTAFTEAEAILSESGITKTQLSKLNVSESFYSFGGISGAPDLVLKTSKPLRDDDALRYAALRLWAICKKIYACNDWESLPPQALQQMEIWRKYTKYPAEEKRAISGFQSHAGRHQRWYTQPLQELCERIYTNKTALDCRVTAKDIFYDLDRAGEYPLPIDSIDRDGDEIVMVPIDERHRTQVMTLRAFRNFYSKLPQEI